MKQVKTLLDSCSRILIPAGQNSHF